MGSGATDDIARAVAAQGDRAPIRALLAQLCDITGMGFAAVARVTDTRWIACQVVDRIEFGLDLGDELELSTTICNEIRQSHAAVIIDDVAGHPDWSRHPTPALYGFESYVALPLILADGSFYGTLCAIDPHARALSAESLIARMREMAAQVAALLSSDSAGPPG